MTLRTLLLAGPALVGLACAHGTESSSSPPAAEASNPQGEPGSAARAAEQDRDRDRAHAPGHGAAPADQVVSGRIAEASPDAVVVFSPDGTRRTLRLADHTAVFVDGRSARATDLSAGQDVRAAYDQLDGENVAVRIDARPGFGAPAPSGTGAAPPGAGAGGPPADGDPGR